MVSSIVTLLGFLAGVFFLEETLVVRTSNNTVELHTTTIPRNNSKKSTLVYSQLENESDSSATTIQDEEQQADKLTSGDVTDAASGLRDDVIAEVGCVGGLWRSFKGSVWYM